MLDFLIAKLHDARFMTMLLAAVAASATAYTLIMPFFAGEGLQKRIVSKVVEDFNLGKWLAQEAARDKLTMAGYRGQAPYVTFLFFRALTPIVMLIGTALYIFV